MRPAWISRFCLSPWLSTLFFFSDGGVDFHPELSRVFSPTSEPPLIMDFGSFWGQAASCILPFLRSGCGGRVCLEAEAVIEVLQRAHTTSDYSLVVRNAAGKVALATYQAAETPLTALARQRTLPNFKESTSIRMGEMGRLEPMTESGEFTATSRAELGETMRLRTFGRRFDATRQLQIVDDANLLSAKRPPRPKRRKWSCC